MTCNNCAPVITRGRTVVKFGRLTRVFWIYNSDIVYLHIMALPDHPIYPIQNFHYQEFGQATFITRVKSLRSFSREIERSDLMCNMQSLLSFNAFRITGIEKIKVIRYVFFCDTRDSR